LPENCRFYLEILQSYAKIVYFLRKMPFCQKSAKFAKIVAITLTPDVVFMNQYMRLTYREEYIVSFHNEFV
jgi:hypothetical protein